MKSSNLVSNAYAGINPSKLDSQDSSEFNKFQESVACSRRDEDSAKCPSAIGIKRQGQSSAVSTYRKEVAKSAFDIHEKNALIYVLWYLL